MIARVLADFIVVDNLAVQDIPALAVQNPIDPVPTAPPVGSL